MQFSSTLSKMQWPGCARHKFSPLNFMHVDPALLTDILSATLRSTYTVDPGRKTSAEKSSPRRQTATIAEKTMIFIEAKGTLGNNAPAVLSQQRNFG
jgi:hypothetical protein